MVRHGQHNLKSDEVLAMSTDAGLVQDLVPDDVMLKLPTLVSTPRGKATTCIHSATDKLPPEPFGHAFACVR